MLSSQRKAHLLAVLSSEGQIVAKTLSKSLGLSEDTIRRDLRELAAEGKLRRVHGGALPVAAAEADFSGRRQISSAAKAAIGEAAAGLVRDDQVIFVDGGTTTEAMVRALSTGRRLTVVTHSPSIAIALVDHSQVEVLLIGGRLFKHSIVAVGAETISAVSRIRADMYFMGVTGVHAAYGLTTGDHEEASVKRAMHKSAVDTVVLASQEKIGAASPFSICAAREISHLVIEKEVPDRSVKPFASQAITVIRA